MKNIDLTEFVFEKAVRKRKVPKGATVGVLLVVDGKKGAPDRAALARFGYRILNIWTERRRFDVEKGERWFLSIKFYRESREIVRVEYDAWVPGKQRPGNWFFCRLKVEGGRLMVVQEGEATS